MTIAELLPCMLRQTRRERLAESPLLAEAARRFEHCRRLRDFENEHLLHGADEASLQVHRVVASDLIADGELLAWQSVAASVRRGAFERLRPRGLEYHWPSPRH
jgi:hypothetical protein